MKALLDEQLSPQIAVLLRHRGYDVIAVAERIDLVGSGDGMILEVASNELRAVVTNNVKDFRPLAAERLASGQEHGGLILVPSSRIRSRAAVAALAKEIEGVLCDNPDGMASSERWIGPLASV
ncbi:MAG: DUF5615 family PIN-like protein [Nocardioidaceae bacterium]